MKSALIVFVMLIVLGVGLAGCASLLARPDGASNHARTSCVGLINIGSCNITQTQTTNAPNRSLGLLAALGAGCLFLGAIWPKGADR